MASYDNSSIRKGVTGNNRLDVETVLLLHDERQRCTDAANRSLQRQHWKDQKRKHDAAKDDGDWGGISMDPELPFQQAIKAVEAVTGVTLPPLSTTSDSMEVFKAFSEAITKYGEKCRQTPCPNSTTLLSASVVSKSMDLMESLNALLNHTSRATASLPGQRDNHRSF